MKSYFLALFVGTLAVPAFIAGCVGVERSYPEKRYFALESTDDRGPSQPINGVALRVRRFRISPRYEGKSFVYRKSEMSYESDFYNEFLVSPASLFTEAVRQDLASSGLFQHVVDPGSPLDLTHTLQGTVSELYGDYRDAGAPKAALAMEFLLVRDSSAHPAIVFQKKYRREITIKERSPESLVRGWSEALKQIMIGLRRDLARVDFSTSPPASK
jgi:cholesterol transport system auxiliary component